jgi:hypothetical protein
MPAGQIIGRFVTMDLLVHIWDLARAVGADERLDEDSVGHAYEALKPMDAMIRQPNVFGLKLDPPPGADLQTEFGRPLTALGYSADRGSPLTRLRAPFRGR